MFIVSLLPAGTQPPRLEGVWVGIVTSPVVALGVVYPMHRYGTRFQGLTVGQDHTKYVVSTTVKLAANYLVKFGQLIF